MTARAEVTRRAPGGPAGRSEVEWIRGPAADRLMMWAWVPFTAVVFALDGDPESIAALTGAVLLLSFSHQSLTLGLVYGDPEVYRQRRILFTISPFVVMIVVAMLRANAFVLLAAIGGVWNTLHTLMQRFGLIRIYGRKVGQERPGIEKGLVFGLFLVPVVAVTASGAGEALRDAGLVGINARGVRFLDDAQPLGAALLVPMVLAALAVTLVWLRQEFRSGRDRNRAKTEYVTSMAVLFAVGLVNPVAGFVGFVGAHALEYYFVVDAAVEGRYQVPDAAPSAIARAVRGPLGRFGTGAAYVTLFVGAVYGLRELGYGAAYITVAMTVGGLHFVYDTFIWKLRRPEHQRSLQLRPTTA